MTFVYLLAIVGALALIKDVFGAVLNSSATKRAEETLEPPPEWTISIEAMKRADDLGRIIDNAICERIAKTTCRRNRLGTPDILADEVGDLCDIVLGHSLDVIGKWEPATPKVK